MVFVKPVNMDDLTRMISYNSCAELESILNEAAVYAAYARRGSIAMEDLTRAVLRTQYGSPEVHEMIATDGMRKTAFHEAGHLVVCEMLSPGSVGLASLRHIGDDDYRGFVHRCRKLPRRAYDIMTCLGGKAAVELYFAETCASGCQDDLQRAARNIRDAVSESGANGVAMIDVATRRFPESSECFTARNEAVVHAEMERYLFMTRDILLKNRRFLEKAAEELMEKGTLLYSDIQRIKEEAASRKASA